MNSATPTSKLPQAVTTCSSSLDPRGALAVMLVRLAAMSLVVCARPVPSRTLPLMRGGEVTKSADHGCVRVVRSESDLDELVTESDSLLVVLRCRGDGNGDSDILEASADSFQRLATARAGSSSIIFAEASADLAAVVAERFGIPPGAATFLCLRNGVMQRQFSAVVAVDVSRMSKIVDSVTASDRMMDDAPSNCGS